MNNVNKVQQLKTEDPVKWYKELKSVCNVVKPPSAIHVPNVAPDDHKAVADAINKHLSSISQQSPEVCTSDLPAYLPAPSPPPQIMPWEMYRELSRVRVRKAGGPDGIAPRLASSSWDKTVRLWNPDTSTLLFVLGGHTGWVKALAFSMDSLYLASAADDETM
ncbi:PREDICTED: lissencephaly-1 homolog [Branchiostoma belcheri]|uniref:Lissencephaly-1 homolog n=1 Tax=Branchiostoma belcheri TaxID=7741 RepID=A0A6P4Z5Z7_BRABE|nr:PREDICTED: lissencephaly-1 homolog [Branchiostoma belcheri]